ncbi:MAG: hypothetical protein J6581_05105 [Apibacter sp.]|jgi:hypothetical protein|nr:hypothetical protein [Apibacter sp.]
MWYVYVVYLALILRVMLLFLGYAVLFFIDEIYKVMHHTDRIVLTYLLKNREDFMGVFIKPEHFIFPF